MPANNIDIGYVRDLVKLMVDNKLEFLQVQGIKLVRNRYQREGEVTVNGDPSSKKSATAREIEDAILFGNEYMQS